MTTKQRTKQKTVKGGGRLRIGDQWNAIRIIARSQTNPLKAVCELVENAIDARAANVQIVRRRAKGSIYLEIRDDGEGISRNEQGEPDFCRIATHICDSLKRYLDQHERAGVHGEFGIGLLSFWNLGEQLQLVSAGDDGRLYEMMLARGKQKYDVRLLRGKFDLGGTRVTIGPLLASTRNIVTGEKLQRYLSAELRDRIRTSGVQIRILDRLSRKDLLVTPREFEGERLSTLGNVSTELGEVVVELYLRASTNGSKCGVSVCKDGTRVLEDITELGQFDRAPWSDGRLEGVVDFAAFELAPGTRGGIVPDEKLEVFTRALGTMEPELVAAIERYEQIEDDRASEQILRQVHRAFVSALRQLPPSEYLFFDIPSPSHPVGKGAEQGAGCGQEADGLAMRCVSQQEPADSPQQEEVVALAFEAGPLAAVKVQPQRCRRRPGEAAQLTASAWDEHSIKILEGVEYHWQAVEGEASLQPHDGGKCTVTRDQAGQVTVQVTAQQGELSAEGQATVKFVEGGGDDEGDSTKGLPTYRLEPEPGLKRRSRYEAKENEIVINSAHRDFHASKTTGAKHRRYIGKMYAKEVVLINFAHETPAEVMERLIEVLVRTEEVL